MSDAAPTLAAVSALYRFVRDGGALLVWGSSVYVALLVPVAIRPELNRTMAAVLRLAVPALAVALAVALPVEAAELGTGWADAFDPGTLRRLLFETTIGTAWLAQALAVATLLAALALPASWMIRVAAAASACLLAALTLDGHAAMHEGLLGALHRTNALVHLLAAGFWLGALLPLVPTLALLGDPRWHRGAAIALHRFSALGHAAVALVIATGALNTALILGRWPTDWASAYQDLLATKIGIVAVMTALAVGNRYGVVPRLRTHPGGAGRVIRCVTLFEISLGLMAVALVAALGQLDPV